MAQEEPIASRVRQAAAGGDQFGISVTVLGELYFAAYASQRREQNLSRLQTLSSALIIWPFDESAAETFGRLQAEQKVEVFQPQRQVLRLHRLLYHLDVQHANRDQHRAGEREPTIDRAGVGRCSHRDFPSLTR